MKGWESRIGNRKSRERWRSALGSRLERLASSVVAFGTGAHLRASARPVDGCQCCSQRLWVSSRSACAAFVDAPCQCGTHQHHANRCRHAEKRRNQQRVLPQRCRAVLHHHGADHSRGHSRLISALSAPCIRITRNSTAQMPLTRKARTRWAMSLSLGGGDLGSGSGDSSQQGQPASRAACPCRNPAGSAEYQRCSSPPLLPIPNPQSLIPAIKPTRCNRRRHPSPRRRRNPHRCARSRTA